MENSILSRIPGEIRNMIFKETLLSPHPIPITPNQAPEPALLRTCSQIRSEGNDFFYHVNETFTATTPYADGAGNHIYRYLYSLQGPRLDDIKNLTIRIEAPGGKPVLTNRSDDEGRIPGVAHYFLTTLPNLLRSLHWNGRNAANIICVEFFSGPVAKGNVISSRTRFNKVKWLRTSQRRRDLQELAWHMQMVLAMGEERMIRFGRHVRDFPACMWFRENLRRADEARIWGAPVIERERFDWVTCRCARKSTLFRDVQRRMRDGYLLQERSIAGDEVADREEKKLDDAEDFREWEYRMSMNVA